MALDFLAAEVKYLSYVPCNICEKTLLVKGQLGNGRVKVWNGNAT